MLLSQRLLLPAVALLTTGFALATPRSAAAQANYTLTPLDAPGASRTQPRGLNDRGEIVGTFRGADNATKGFVLKNGVYTTLQAPGASSTFSVGINNFSAVVGYATTAGVRRGFVLKNGTYTTVEVPGATQTLATGINDWGTVVGTYVDSAAVQHGFLLKNGTYTTIDVPTAGYTIPYAINNWGTIVGAYQDAEGEVTSFRRYKRFQRGADGTYTTIASEGLEEPTALGINDWGTVVGNYEEIFGFILYTNNTFVDVVVPGSSAVWVQDINNSGKIVGYYQDATTGAFRGYVGVKNRPTQ